MKRYLDLKLVSKPKKKTMARLFRTEKSYTGGKQNTGIGGETIYILQFGRLFIACNRIIRSRP